MTPEGRKYPTTRTTQPIQGIPSDDDAFGATMPIALPPHLEAKRQTTKIVRQTDPIAPRQSAPIPARQSGPIPPRLSGPITADLTGVVGVRQTPFGPSRPI